MLLYLIEGTDHNPITSTIIRTNNGKAYDFERCRDSLHGLNVPDKDASELRNKFPEVIKVINTGDNPVTVLTKEVVRYIAEQYNINKLEENNVTKPVGRPPKKWGRNESCRTIPRDF